MQTDRKTLLPAARRCVVGCVAVIPMVGRLLIARPDRPIWARRWFERMGDQPCPVQPRRPLVHSHRRVAATHCCRAHEGCGPQFEYVEIRRLEEAASDYVRLTFLPAAQNALLNDTIFVSTQRGWRDTQTEADCVMRAVKALKPKIQHLDSRCDPDAKATLKCMVPRRRLIAPSASLDPSLKVSYSLPRWVRSVGAYAREAKKAVPSMPRTADCGIPQSTQRTMGAKECLGVTSRQPRLPRDAGVARTNFALRGIDPPRGTQRGSSFSTRLEWRSGTLLHRLCFCASPDSSQVLRGYVGSRPELRRLRGLINSVAAIVLNILIVVAEILKQY